MKERAQLKAKYANFATQQITLRHNVARRSNQSQHQINIHKDLKQTIIHQDLSNTDKISSDHDRISTEITIVTAGITSTKSMTLRQINKSTKVRTSSYLRCFTHGWTTFKMSPTTTTLINTNQIHNDNHISTPKSIKAKLYAVYIIQSKQSIDYIIMTRQRLRLK